MALILETGAGVLTAEAYADAAAYIVWATAMYGAAPTDTPVLIEAAIRRSVRYLDGLNWNGLKTYGRTLQALAWPRGWITDRDGWAITTSTIPAMIDGNIQKFFH